MKLRTENQESCGQTERFSRGFVKLRFLRDYWELEAVFFCGFRSRSVAFISGLFLSSGHLENIAKI